jgi:acylphosphatase
MLEFEDRVLQLGVMMGENKTAISEIHAIVHGYVQGVCFRATTSKHARRLGLVGTVKNLSDGTVEIFAQGKRVVLEQLLEDLKSQPGYGEVERVEANFYSPKKSFKDFQVIF